MAKDPSSDLTYTNQWSHSFVKKHFDRIGSNGFKSKNRKRVHQGPIAFADVYEGTIAYICKTFLTDNARRQAFKTLANEDLTQEVLENLFSSSEDC